MGGHKSRITQKLKVLLNKFSSLLLNIHSRTSFSSTAREFHSFQCFLLGLVDEFRTWMCLLTHLLGTHYWAIHELNAAVTSSRRVVDLTATMFSCLSWHFAHTIKFLYKIKV